MLFPPMLYSGSGSNMLSNRFYPGQGNTEFNVMDHFGLMLGPNPFQLQAPPDGGPGSGKPGSKRGKHQTSSVERRGPSRKHMRRTEGDSI